MLSEYGEESEERKRRMLQASQPTYGVGVSDSMDKDSGWKAPPVTGIRYDEAKQLRKEVRHTSYVIARDTLRNLRKAEADGVVTEQELNQAILGILRKRR